MVLQQQEAQLAPSVDIGNIILIIVYLVLIIIAAYFVTKYFAKRSLRKGMKSGGGGGFRRGNRQKKEFGHMVSVADRIAVDRDKTLMVVEFQGKYYLVGTHSQGFECIDKVDIPAEAEDAINDEMASDEGFARTKNKDGTGAVQEESFFKRFKKSFLLVFSGYMPKSKNKGVETPFDVHLKDEMNAQADKNKKDGDKNQT